MASSITPEKFESGDIVSWLRQFECCASANNWHEKKKLAVLPAFLRGPAATYYHALADDKKNTYANLTKSNGTEMLSLTLKRAKSYIETRFTDMTS